MTLEKFADILTALSLIITTIGASVGFFYFKKLNTIGKAITLYLATMTAVEIIARLFTYLYKNNLSVLLVYSLIELGIFSIFYHKHFLKSKYNLLIILNVISIIYILWEIITYRNMHSINFQAYSKVIDDFNIILLVLTFLYEKMNQEHTIKWQNIKLNIALLLFFTINLIFFLPYNFIINNDVGLQFYFLLGVLIITILFYTYLTHLLWQNLKK